MDDGSNKFRSIQHCINNTGKNNKTQIQLTNEQIKHFGFYPQLVTTIEYLTKTYNLKEEKSFKDFEKKLISCVKIRKKLKKIMNS